MTTERAAVVRVRRLMAKHGPDLLARLRTGTPLRTALAALLLPPDVEDDLAARADVKAALASREESLRAQLADPDRGRRDAAIYELETLHGWRRPGTTTVEQRFGSILERFREWVRANPDAKAATTFNALRDLLVDKKETAAERRRNRRLGR